MSIPLPPDDRYPILCSDGTVIRNVEGARKKEADFPGSFTPQELMDAGVAPASVRSAALLLDASPRHRSPLARLREKYPDQKWRAVRDGMGWDYESAEGWSAGWRSCLAPKWGGDDETCVSRFFVYKPGAPTEEVFFG